MLKQSNMQRFFKVVLLFTIFMPFSQGIQCFSGSQLQIIECSSISCIKQSMGLDTVRYCDGTGSSSICQTYNLIEMCQDIPNMGHVCCCSDQLCNSAFTKSLSSITIIASTIFLLFRLF